jgi:toxin ParE1/3/4
MKIRYTRRAAQQIDEIATYLRGSDPDASKQFLGRVETVAGLPARHPMIGRPTDIESLRVFRLSPFQELLFYRVGKNGIDILRVRHTARAEEWKKGS